MSQNTSNKLPKHDPELESNITWDLVSLVEEKRGKITAQKEEQREKDKKRLSEIKLTGFLSKRVNMVQGWRPRYFVLANGEFKYARQQDSKKFINIPLANAVFLKQRGKTTTRFVVDSDTLVVQLRAKDRAQRDKWLDALSEVKNLLNSLNDNKHDEDAAATASGGGTTGPSSGNTSANTSPGNTTTNNGIEPLAKMRDWLSRIHRIKDTLVGQLGPNFDGVLDGGKVVAKKDTVKDIAPQLQELFSAVTNLEEEVDIVTTSLLEQIEALQDQCKHMENEKQDFESSELDEQDDESNQSEVEFFDAEEHWDNYETSENKTRTTTTTTIMNSTTLITTTPRRGSAKNRTPRGKVDSSESESDKEFFSDLSPEVRKSEEGSRYKKEENLSPHANRSKSLIHSLIEAQMPKQTLNTNLEATFNTVPSSFKPRDRLPHNKDFVAKISLAKILKDAIGKDVTRMTIPVVFSEPLSLLQRLAEEHEYADLLTTAATKEDSCLRLAYAAAFAVSSYSSTPGRFTKPFNPLLGETFEFIHKKKSFRLLAEQVSHHPPVSAAFAEGREWTMWGHAFVKLKFWGKSFEIFPDGYITAEIPKFQDKFVWNKVTTVVNNIIVGTKWIDHYGEMLVINQNTGDKCKVNFEKTGWFTNANGRVEGIVYNSKNTRRFKLEGSWQSSLTCTAYNNDELDPSTTFTIWEKDPMPEWALQQFNYTFLAIQCNELPDFLRPVLPRTDSRWRPDQRAFENGDVELAQSEKHRLEEAQRARRVIQPESEYEPHWFHKKDYSYKGGYWEQRLSGKFTDIPDIFEMELDRGSSVPEKTPQANNNEQPIVTVNTTTTAPLEKSTKERKRKTSESQHGTTGSSTTPTTTQKSKSSTLSVEDESEESKQERPNSAKRHTAEDALSAKREKRKNRKSTLNIIEEDSSKNNS